MITIEQIRAARAMLDWTQNERAQGAGISQPAINNIERRLGKPRVETMQAIQKAFEKAGVEFIEGGARFRADTLNVRTLEGDESVTRLLFDVLDTLAARTEKKELLVSGIQEQRFVQICGDKFNEYLRRVKELSIGEKLLAMEHDDFFVTDIENYRWVTADIFSQVPYFVYGDKYAMILWGPPVKIVLIENEAIAESFRRQFYAHWNRGKFSVVKKK